jgi:hypothetical protein
MPADGIVDSAVLAALRAVWLRFCPGFVFGPINTNYTFTCFVSPFVIIVTQSGGVLAGVVRETRMQTASCDERTLCSALHI